jgi:hypothetical protein
MRHQAVWLKKNYVACNAVLNAVTHVSQKKTKPDGHLFVHVEEMHFMEWGGNGACFIFRHSLTGAAWVWRTTALVLVSDQ